jgi:HK97 family phage portal protein
MHRQEIRDHPVAQLIGTAPNPDATPISFYSTLVLLMLLWGNGFAEIQRNPVTQQPLAMWIRASHLTDVHRDDGGLLYYTTRDTPDSKQRTVKADDMIHCAGLSLDGIVGLPTVKMLRQEIGQAMAQTIYGSRYYASSGVPSVAITYPGTMKPEQKTELRHAWNALFTGGNTHQAAILDQGQSVEVLTAKPIDGQLVEAAKLSAEKLCWSLGVPPSILGLNDRAPRASAEQQDANFLKYGLGPILARIEQPMTAKLAPTASYIIRADTRSLLRSSITDRATYYTQMRNAGILSANECRAMEDLPSIPDGDRYLEPANMNEVGAASNKEELDEELDDSQDGIEA